MYIYTHTQYIYVLIESQMPSEHLRFPPSVFVVLGNNLSVTQKEGSCENA